MTFAVGNGQPTVRPLIFCACAWVQRNPGLVHRMVLLCPGVDLCERWRHMLGERRMREWATEVSTNRRPAVGAHFGDADRA